MHADDDTVLATDEIARSDRRLLWFRRRADVRGQAEKDRSQHDCKKAGWLGSSAASPQIFALCVRPQPLRRLNPSHNVSFHFE
jgi:hypothetical protein